MSNALLIVDIQNDYFPGGKMELEGADAAAVNAARLLAAFRDRRLPVVHMQHISTRPGAGFFLPDTPGVQIHASVAPLAEETVMQKNFPNSFRQTRLLEHLKQNGVTDLVVAGMMTHMCIDATVRAAFDLGFRCRLVHDACATRALAFGGLDVPAKQVHGAFIASLHGIFATVLGTNELLAAL